MTTDTSAYNPLVSVIIPTRNSAQFLEACLKSVQDQAYRNIEIIVVDNNSTDTTQEIAKKYTDKVFTKGPERSAQRNYGVSQSKGEYVLIIDSDMVVSSKVIEACIQKIDTDASISALIIPEESFGEGFWAHCKKLERSFYVEVEWMEGARFFTKPIFNEMNGYDEQNTGTEDFDLPQRIEAKYGSKSINRINQYIFHDEQKISLFKTCKKKFYYAKKLDKYTSIEANKDKFSKQSSIIERYKLFFSQPRKLFKNPLLGCGMLFMKTAEMGAGGLGFIFAKL